MKEMNQTVICDGGEMMKNDQDAGIIDDAMQMEQAETRSEQMLRASELSYRRLFEAAKEGILILEADTGRISDVNPFLIEMLGFSRGELVGTPIWELDPFRDVVSNKAKFEQLQQQGYVRYENLPLETRDGRKIAVEFVGNVYQTGDKQVIQCNIRDITERKRAETASVRLAAIIESSDDAIISKDLNSIITSWNKGAERIFGYAASDMVGTPIMRLIPADRRDEENRLQERIECGESVEHFETLRQTKDGRLINVSATASPIKDATGKVIGMSTVARDITERKRAEEALRASQQIIEEIINAIPVRVFWKDKNLVYLGCNAVFARDAGFADPKDIIGKDDYQMGWRDQAEKYRGDDRQVIESGCPKLFIEEPQTTPEGNTITLLSSKLPLRNSKGEISGILGTYMDITERKRLEAQLSQSQKMETVGKLAGGIAHEFNSILTAIIGQSELLLGDLPAGSPLAKNATEISKAAGRAATLTRQLLAYGRKQFLQPEALDLNRVIASMEAMFHHLMGVDVVTQIVTAAGLKAVRADAGQIEQVIMNMALNARDAMPNGGKLTLETANVSFGQESVGRDAELKPGDYVMLAITDTGAGMSAEVRAHVFEPFFTTKGVGQGTGLGLSTCYGIIKQSGGHISVYSEPARGTTFKIYLPQVEQQTKIPIQRFDSSDLPRGTETILLVEDDPALREMAATLLRRLGYTVLAADNGLEALRLTHQKSTGYIDLLFTDVVMPQMSGKELSDRIHALHPNTKILFTSAYTESAIVHQGALNPGVELLQKPFTPSALAHKVRGSGRQERFGKRESPTAVRSFGHTRLRVRHENFFTKERREMYQTDITGTLEQANFLFPPAWVKVCACSPRELRFGCLARTRT